MVKERQGKVCYYLGKAYLEMKRPLKVHEYWSAMSKEQLDSGSALRKKEVKTFLLGIREVKNLIQKIEKHIQ